MSTQTMMDAEAFRSVRKPIPSRAESRAYGKSLRDVLLLDSATGNHQSMVAAANAELHEKLLSFFDARILQWEQLLKRREERRNS